MDKNKITKYIFGVILLILAIATWVGPAIYSQIVFTDLNYDKFLFLAWWANAWCTLSFPIWIFFTYIVNCIRLLIQKCKQDSNNLELQDSDTLINSSNNEIQNLINSNNYDSIKNSNIDRINNDRYHSQDEEFKATKLTFNLIDFVDESVLKSNVNTLLKERNWKALLKKQFTVALFFTPVQVSCGYTWYISLANTDITLNTSLYQSSTLWAFLITIVNLWIDKKLFPLSIVTKIQFCAVFLTLIGLIMLPLATTIDSDSTNGIGIFTVILSAILFVVYQFIFDTNIAGEPPASAILFLSIVGFICLTMYWPFIVLVDLVGFEIFQLPTGQEVDYVFIAGSSGLAFLFSIILAVNITNSPVFVTTGVVMTIPVSAVCDTLIFDYKQSITEIFGLIILLIGFILINIAEIFNKKEKS
eukprot:TRINITY_DN1776_c0_g5_i1.p1 TRINITY_DN1776_c0_g5~~TRINITY_DN1776_c0_g5_i1.p1  ORF type:complete len:416 (+),score=153.49 TRINITY_DN1776_c0_g5_i1:37-1284(+)